MRVKKNILPGAAFAALVAAVIVYCVMLNVEKNALAAFEKGMIWAAVCEVPKGTVFTEENVRDYFTEREVDIGLIPDKAIRQKEELYHKMTTVTLDEGCLVTESLFQDLKQTEAAMAEPVVAGFKADDLYQVVSGTLRSGDTIHIYTADPDTGEVYLVWDHIFVQEVFDSAGTAISPGNRSAAAHRVNILMEKDHVEQFYSELARGSLRVVKALDKGGGDEE